jgi:hypothetical protein
MPCPLDLLLHELRRLPHASQVRVFGSLITDKSQPVDVDVGLVALECATWDHVRQRYAATVHTLLALAHAHYGWLDPYVLLEGNVVVRNDEATGWKVAANAGSISQAILNGWSLEHAIQVRVDKQHPVPRASNTGHSGPHGRVPRPGPTSPSGRLIRATPLTKQYLAELADGTVEVREQLTLKEVAQQVDRDGDRWNIAGVGVTDDQGRVYCHLASTTRFRQQRNGRCPVQSCDWIPSALLQPVQLSAEGSNGKRDNGAKASGTLPGNPPTDEGPQNAAHAYAADGHAQDGIDPQLEDSYTDEAPQKEIPSPEGDVEDDRGEFEEAAASLGPP